MKIFSLLFFTLFFHHIALAKSFHFDDYEAASKSKEFLKFESESTKMGFITTSFDGFAKDFEINYKIDKGFITEIFLVIKSQSLDTDNSSRDEKMHEQIIGSKKHPSIIFASGAKIPLKEGETTLKGRLTIQKVSKEKEIKLNIKKNEDGTYLISGESFFSLKEYKLPDPSIAIASVRDQFDVKFALHIEK